MKKSATLLVLFLIPALASALAVQSCAGGESTGGGSGSGGKTGSGGSTNTGTGGFTSTGTGGFTSTGTGGFTSTGTGGITNPGTGGMVGGGTGGMIGGGTGGMIGGGTGGTTIPAGAILVSGGGFGTNGTWMGYGYTATFGTTATVMPVCPTPCFPATTTQFCAMGNVAIDPTSGSGALLGWNLSQVVSTSAVSPAINPITPTGTGVLVNLSGSATGLRAQIQNAAGLQWCANLTATGPTMIPWTMFNTKCYNTAAGTPFPSGTPITALQIVVPSSATAALPFNFCLVDAHSY